MTHLIGIDIGATNIKAGRVNPKGRVLETLTIETEASLGVEKVIRKVIGIIEKFSKTSRIEAIGIAVPGLVDPVQGIVHSPPNLPGWKRVPLKTRLESSLEKKIPIFVHNDVNMVTYGEWRLGAGKGTRNLLCITLGTGVGGCIIANGKLYLGGRSWAGEIGHTIVDPDGPPCKCGGRGCLEALVGAEAMKRRTICMIQKSMGSREFRESGSQNFKDSTDSLDSKDSKDTIILKSVKGDLEKITPEVVSRSAQKGDPIAQEILKQAGEEIGIALTNAMALLDPEKVVIGGGISKAGKVLFDPIRKTIQERLYTMKSGKVAILPSKLGDMAGVIGSAIYAYEKFTGS